MATDGDLKVSRIDRVELSLPVTDRWGFLHVEAIVSRPGVYDYRQPDGTIRREFKPPEEIYSPEHIASVRDAVVTDEHPMGGLAVTPANSSEHFKGHATSAGKSSGGLKAAIKITDRGMIAVLGRKQKRGVSLGLDAEIDPTPGVWQGQAYDVVQRKMRTNQISITDEPRVGGAEIRLDSMKSDDAIMVDDPPKDRRPMAMKLKIGDSEVELDAGAGSVVQAYVSGLESRLTTADSKLKVVEGERDAALAKLDAAEKELKEKEGLEIKREDLPELFEQRAKILKAADSILGADWVKANPKATDDEIRRAALAKDDIDTEGKSDVWIEARFDALVEYTAKSVSKSDSLAKKLAGVTPVSPEELEKTDSKKDDSPQARVSRSLEGMYAANKTRKVAS